MDFSQLQSQPGIWLDSRRGVFLKKKRILAVADLHLGYSWAHRFHGQMLPLHQVDPWADRLTALCDTYEPQTMILLGDIVHQAVPVPALRSELETLAERFSNRSRLLLLLGNHDRKLRELPRPESLQIQSSFYEEGIYFSHGDTPAPADLPINLAIIGHEHPAISLGDGITSSKFPCFLLAPKLIVLPAFSLWASGTSIGTFPFISPISRTANFKKAVAIMGSRLLAVPLDSSRSLNSLHQPDRRRREGGG